MAGPKLMEYSITQKVLAMEPQTLRSELQTGDSADLKWRRRVIGLSLFGVGVTAVISMFQTGILRHLPDPPLDSFDSEKVMSSDPAYMWGNADATMAMTTAAANLPIASFGGADRARDIPSVPLLATAKAAVDAASAGWYFYQMAAKQKRWCIYCITTAATFAGIFALTLPEAMSAINELRRRDHD
jgi:uncharacterized membrane protein